RFLLEHLVEQQVRGASVELETESFIQTKSPITAIQVLEWQKVKVRLGSLDLCWRDTGSRYYFYPDKVEIRPEDERIQGFKLFFSFPFKSSQGLLNRFQNLKSDPQISYWHPDLE
ncbi:MAG TPA: hypothetical protein VNU93_06255, partial [Verrucomicrobiae bacterium]|nr:hypothetical protein [Verrucomicrobiae bacterium]